MKTKTFFRFFLLGVMTLFTLGAWAQSTPDKNYLCFTAEEAGATVRLNKNGSPADVSLEYYCTSDVEPSWKTFTPGSTTATLTNVGDKVYFRSTKTTTTFSQSGADYYQFALSGNVAASGNVMSLIDQDCSITDISNESYNWCFCNLFFRCSSLTAAPALPATKLSIRCYYNMFFQCTNLVTAPVLPATELASNCYMNMFIYCTSLVTAPAELPAETLAEDCYASMFSGCTSLKTAPALHATTLAGFCCSSMFEKCTSLETAPALPATTLADRCYMSMFSGCKNLKTTPELPAKHLPIQCYMNMFRDCTNLTTAELQATTFDDVRADEGPCNNMFYGCTNLNSVKVAFTEGYGRPNTESWLRNVASTGTFVCPAELDVTTRDVDHVPAGWTVKKIANEITFDDATPYTANYDMESGKLTYKRTFAEEGKYEALYLPFSVKMTSDLSDKVTIAKIYMVSTKGSVVGGAQDAGVDVVVVKALEEGESTKPHTPYFIRSKSGTDLEFTQNNTTLYAATSAQPGHITCATTMDSYDFIGSYTGETLNQEDGKSIYVLQNGGLHKVTAETTQPCNRWKMVKTPTEWNDNYVAPSAKAKMQIITLGEDETTGIIGLDARMNADSTNDAIYTPAGVAVRKQQLTPGLYIQHGKKFIVK